MTARAMGAAGTVTDLTRRGIDLLGQVVAWLMLALVLLVSGDVLGRYLLGLGNVALQELEWHLVVTIALLGMAYDVRRGGHVRVDVLYERMRPGSRAAVDLLTGVLTILFAGVAIDLSLPYVAQSYAIGEGSPDPGGLPDRFIIKACIPLGFSFLLLQGVAMTLESLRTLCGHRRAVTTDRLGHE